MEWEKALPLLQENHSAVAISVTPKGRAQATVVSTALLDGITRVPPAERFTVGRLLRDSVECPMPGPSHRKVTIEWRL